MKFSSDLRRIREARNLSLEALHDETKIPLSVLEEFEETGLFDNPMFNRVYLRSLVRTYASFIDVPTKAMLEALDAALLDTYEGSLAQIYLKDTSAKTAGTSEDNPLPVITESSASEEPPSAAPPVEKPTVKEPALEAPVVEAPTQAVPVGEEEAPEAPVVEAPVYDAPVQDENAPEAPTDQEASSVEIGVVEEIQHLLRTVDTTHDEAAEDTTQDEAAEVPEGQGVEAPDTPAEHPARGRTRPPLLTTAEATRERPSSRAGRRRKRPVDVKRRAWYTQWVVIAGAVLVFIVAIWAVIVLVDRPEDTSRQQVATTDSTAADSAATAIQAEPVRPQLILADTLYVVLLATEKVERIQIRRDNDLLRAYWIEQGVAKAFPALERIVIENRLGIIRLFVEGFEYPTTIRDENNRVVITRAGLQAFADTLTASPIPLPALPDTIPMWPVRGQ